MSHSAASGADPYTLLRTSCLSIPQDRSILILKGGDTMDFLQRLSTADLSRLAPGEGGRTIFVSEKGRVIDLVTVVRSDRGAVLVGSPGAAATLAAWLDRFIIMDDVSVDHSADRFRLESLYGPEAPARAPSGVRDGGGAASGKLAVREDVGGVPGVLLVPPDLLEGSAPGGPAASGQADPAPDRAAAFELVRIEEMVPAAGRELGPEVNPLEAGLKRFISFTKGCYIGQEVIARLDTYRKLRSIIALYRLDADPGAPPGPGAVMEGEQEAGRITSIALSPRFGGWIGLGTRRIALAGTPLHLRTAEGGVRIPCEAVSAMPEGYGEYGIEA